ncbi:AlkZ-related protein [Allorhodopirellula solitaria]|uniref:AlkZ-related protein n=1 Tax=Allorhodopirellula solitaria TaxID=2527987 RepID=UPI001FE809BA|nr:hypothetical protein [Allorhodopirellula solitaria]
MRQIKTFDDAYQFVLEQKVCTVFGSKGSPYPSLWDGTALSEAKPKAGGWSPKVTAVWDWKTRLPQTYPDEVFYGKVRGGDAVLMEMQHFREEHYPQFHKPAEQLGQLEQQIFEMVRLEQGYTGELRKRAMNRLACTKSQFETALKKLQISLNLVRSNDTHHKNDYWLPMSEVHLELVADASANRAAPLGLPPGGGV